MNKDDKTNPKQTPNKPPYMIYYILKYMYNDNILIIMNLINIMYDVKTDDKIYIK